MMFHDKDGNMLWEKPLPFQQLFAGYSLMADRNLTEDAFYVNISMYGYQDWNKIDGKGRIQKYNGSGDLVWYLPLSP